MARQRNSANECRWLELIRLWQQSGLSVRAFCQRHQLGEPRFYVWRRVLRQRGLMDRMSARRAATTPTFVKVAVAGMVQRDASNFSTGTKTAWPSGTNA